MSGRVHSLISLVSRFLVAQAGASAALGVGYSRRNLPWLVVSLVIAVALCALAGLVRSGGHSVWLAAIGIESGLATVGVFWFLFYARYLGGTLLAMATLGALLHPKVSRAFAAARPAAAPAPDEIPADIVGDGASLAEAD